MNNLKHIRTIREMSQETFATLAGVPGLFQEQISELENGKRPPTEPERAALSAVLGTPAEKIFPEPDSDGLERWAYK